MSARATLRVAEVRLAERAVRLRMPFRFGVTTLTEAPQAFARVRVESPDGASAWGVSAEVLAPKWFDKRAELGNEENFDQLRLAVALAREAYLAAGPASAFGLAADCYRDQLRAGAAADLNALTASFGPALLDRAVLDALCRLEGIGVAEALRANRVGFEPALLAPDLDGLDAGAWLASLAPGATVHARHTVGMADPLVAADRHERLDDGLPETLEEVIAAYGQRFFKLKVCGDRDEDLDRLDAIAAVLDGAGVDYRVTIDGNEQYEALDGVLELWEEMSRRERLARLRSRTLLVEQPIARARALATDVSRLSSEVPVIVDESDDSVDVFPVARERGYRGVSSKGCKGIYKSLVNAARCVRWNAAGEGGYFMTGEDLTCQAGVAVQQDLAWVSLLGIAHVERNGHHYVRGMHGAPPAEQAAFLESHPDLYRDVGGAACLRIERGRVALGSLWRAGFARSVDPDFSAMTPMTQPPSPDGRSHPRSARRR